jgi:hypothetical protein
LAWPPPQFYLKELWKREKQYVFQISSRFIVPDSIECAATQVMSATTIAIVIVIPAATSSLKTGVPVISREMCDRHCKCRIKVVDDQMLIKR